jgi:membrane fusion protein, heavy metal efflux system
MKTHLDNPRPSLLWLAFSILFAAQGCTPVHAGGGEHGHGHSQGPEPLALTLWSETHELFVEFDPPVAGKPSGYHAHVSRIADNRAATAGKFTVRFDQATGKAATEIAVDKVARKGIFTPKGKSPGTPGLYRLIFLYQDAEVSSRWDAGQLKLSSKPANLPAPQAEGGITFLKEQQWNIPFATRHPVKRPLSRELALPATVAADPALTRTVTAPSSGAVLWSGEQGPSVIGMTVKRGQVLGRLEPSAAPDHVSTLQLQIQRGLIERDLAQKTFSRLDGLAAQGLVPARRVTDARATLRRAEATLKAARQKASQLRGRSVGALPLVAPADGTLVELHVTTGHEAVAGEVLAHVAGERTVLVKAAAFSLDLPRLSVIRGARLRMTGQDKTVPLKEGKAHLLTRRVVVNPATLTAPVAYQVENKDGALRIGEPAELRVAVGSQQPYLTVPQAAVVEINTRPYLFVMRTGESFARLPVKLGPTDGQHTAITAGLAPTDRVVTAGAFDVYAASLAGDVESHRH